MEDLEEDKGELTFHFKIRHFKIFIKKMK